MVILNPNPTNRNLQLPTQEKTVIKLKVKCKKNFSARKWTIAVHMVGKHATGRAASWNVKLTADKQMRVSIRLQSRQGTR